jgi:nicotinate (nicotinamide) nucleotide adenylyltransferase
VIETVQVPHRLHVAVFGGSFNPVHLGHVELIDAALAVVDHVLAVPAGRSPFKGEQQLLPGDLRYRMLRAALRGKSRVSVLDWELRRPLPSYTVDTLEALAAWLLQARLSLLMGADAYRGFAEWRQAGRILERADLLLFARGDGSNVLDERPAHWAACLPEPFRSRVRPLDAESLADESGRVIVRRMDAPIVPISSTHIRQSGAWAEVPPGARGLLEAHLAAQGQ